MQQLVVDLMKEDGDCLPDCSRIHTRNGRNNEEYT